jgi:hypothetical protein
MSIVLGSMHVTGESLEALLSMYSQDYAILSSFYNGHDSTACKGRTVVFHVKINFKSKCWQNYWKTIFLKLHDSHKQQKTEDISKNEKKQAEKFQR